MPMGKGTYGSKKGRPAKKGKMKKLKPGYAQGYHGKADPAAGMKGMMDKGDTKAFGTKKKIGSMK